MNMIEVGPDLVIDTDGISELQYAPREEMECGVTPRERLVINHRAYFGIPNCRSEFEHLRQIILARNAELVQKLAVQSAESRQAHPQEPPR